MISVTNLRIVTTVLFGVAQLATCARIGFRFKRHRLWFDDVIASLAVVCSVVGLVYFWMNMTEDVGPLAWSEMSRTRSSWVVNGMFPSVIWSSRLAILFSMIRVLPYNLRGLPYAAGSAFVMMWSAILALTVTMCEPSTEWQKVNHQCKGHVTLVTTLFFELASALFLIVSPAVISARLPADTAVIQHGTVASIAVVGFFSLAGSISHTTFFVQSKGNLEQLTVCVQVATALLFTSLPAFVVIVYRSPELDLDDPSHTGSALPLGRWRFSAASSKAPIGFPRPLSARSSASWFTSQTPMPPNFLPHHVSFSPAAPEEKRHQKDLMLNPPAQTSSTRDGSLMPRTIYSSDENATEVEHIPSLVGNRTVRFNLPSKTHSSATVRSGDSIMYSYPIINRPPSTYVEAKRESQPRSWISGDSAIHDDYNRSPAPTPEALGSDRTTFAKSHLLVPSDVRPVRSLILPVTDTYSPSTSEVDLSTYSALISKYFVDEDPHGAHNMGTVAVDGQREDMPELASLSPVWLPGPEPSRAPQVRPF